MSTFKAILNDSDKSVDQRVLEMIRFLLRSIQSEEQSKKGQRSEANHLKIEIKSIQKSCTDILGMFEDKFSFPQQLSYRADFQWIRIFLARLGSSTPFTEESKAELIGFCASLCRFVEETIGLIASETVENAFADILTVYHLRIFYMLNSHSIDFPTAHTKSLLRASKSKKSQMTEATMNPFNRTPNDFRSAKCESESCFRELFLSTANNQLR
jgi:hypothetical protein